MGEDEDWNEDVDLEVDEDDDDNDGEVCMTTTDWIGGACNGHLITGLSDGASAKAKMETWFKQEMMQSKSVFGSKSAGFFTPAAHYVFSQGGATYGTKFADYIEENKLGTLATCGSIENVKYHPGRKCQVWIWVPDMKALAKWWKENVLPKEDEQPKKDG